MGGRACGLAVRCSGCHACGAVWCRVVPCGAAWCSHAGLAMLGHILGLFSKFDGRFQLSRPSYPPVTIDEPEGLNAGSMARFPLRRYIAIVDIADFSARPG